MSIVAVAGSGIIPNGILMNDPDYAWFIMDPSYREYIPRQRQPRGGNQEMNRTKGGSTPRYISDADGLPVRNDITGTSVNCQQAYRLMDGIGPENLLADRADDTNEILESFRTLAGPGIPYFRRSGQGCLG